MSAPEEWNLDDFAKLELAEKVFKLAIHVENLAQTEGLPDSKVIAWTYGQHSFDFSVDGLSPTDSAGAASALMWVASRVLIIELREFLFGHKDKFQNEFLIVRHLRNAFAHAPFNPIWDIRNPIEEKVYEIPGVFRMDLSRRNNTPVKWQDYGGPIALLRLSEYIRREVPMNQTPGLNIGMLLFPDLTQLDLTGPYEVFTRLPGARVMLLAKSLEPVRSEKGLALLPDTRLADCPDLDVVFVPGGVGINPVMEDKEILDFLRDKGAKARYVTSACTGSLVLAAAGLLKGYKAACHWLSLDLLAGLGAIPVAERVVKDRNRFTGGGITAGIDFALALAAEIYGPETAQSIQLHMEYNPAPPFPSMGSPSGARPETVERLRILGAATRKEREAIVERIRQGNV